MSVPQYFHPMLEEGGYDNKIKDLVAHHVEHLYKVMMVRILQGDTLSANNLTISYCASSNASLEAHRRKDNASLGKHIMYQL